MEIGGMYSLYIWTTKGQWGSLQIDLILFHIFAEKIINKKMVKSA